MRAPKLVDRLYARLARLAGELDEFVMDMAAADLTHEEAESLDVGAIAVRLGADAVADALWRSQQLDERQRRRDRAIDRALVAARSGRGAATQTGVRNMGTQISRSTFPPAGAERERVFWRLSANERVALMRAGELSLAECCRWAARAAHEVPLVNGEFEFIAAFSSEARDV